MKTFTKDGAQGEITFKRIGDLKPGMTMEQHMLAAGLTGKPLEVEDGHLIIGHSETGHHHVLDKDAGEVMVLDKAPEGMKILHAILLNPTELKHLRDHDTHESVMFDPGVYEFRLSRENDPFAENERAIRALD